MPPAQTHHGLCVESHPRAPLFNAALTTLTEVLLQGRLLDKDGHSRKAKAGEDPHNIGLSLEYIFGSFVSANESA